jgi:hypothetical protein
LASLNRRRRPTVVSGVADFAGVLLATAGFLILGGPLILAGLHEVWRRHTLRGSFADIRAALAQPSGFWHAVWVAYLVLVVAGSAWLLFRRRVVTVVYNIDPTDAQKLVSDLNPGERLPVPMDGQDIPTVMVIPAMRHATLRWPARAGAVRRRFEADLRRLVATLDSPDNPLAGWLLATATGLYAFLIILLGLFVALVWSLRG